LSAIYAKGAAGILRFGGRHIKTAAKLLSESEKHINLRKKETVGIIDHVAGIRCPEARQALLLTQDVPVTRIEVLFAELDDRDRAIAKGFRRIAGFIRAGKIGEAVGALRSAKNNKDIVGEPEYENIERDIDLTIKQLNMGEVRDALRKIDIMVKRSVNSTIMHRMTKEYLEGLVDAEIIGTKEIDRENLFKTVFEKNIISNGMKMSLKERRLFMAKLYQLVHISHYSKKTRKTLVKNTVFQAVSAFIYICRTAKASSLLADGFLRENNLIRTGHLLKKIKTQSDRVKETDMDEIGKAIIEDMVIRGHDKGEFMRCAQIGKVSRDHVMEEPPCLREETSALGALVEGISDPADLARKTVEGILSAGISSRVTLAFEENIGGDLSSKVLEVIFEIQKLKIDAKYARILKNVNIKKFRSGSALQQLREDIKNSGKVLVFARKRDRELVSDLEKKVSMVYLDDENLPGNAYYPLLEAVVITLSGYVPGVSTGGFFGLFPEVNISSLEKKEGYLLFKLLPLAREFDRMELIKRYAELKRLLRSV
jgi:hypothetical protein